MATACTWTTSSKRATRYGKRARQHGGLRPGRAWAATRPGGVGIGWQRRAAWPGRARRPGRPARRPPGGYANTARTVLKVARKGLSSLSKSGLLGSASLFRLTPVRAVSPVSSFLSPLLSLFSSFIVIILNIKL